MRWKTHKPEDGEQRIRRFFALWPTEVDTGETVWLEWLWAVDTYYDGKYTVGFDVWITDRISIDYPEIKEAHNGTD